jgi:hypothetical protein
LISRILTRRPKPSICAAISPERTGRDSAGSRRDVEKSVSLAAFETAAGARDSSAGTQPQAGKPVPGLNNLGCVPHTDDEAPQRAHLNEAAGAASG